MNTSVALTRLHEIAQTLKGISGLTQDQTEAILSVEAELRQSKHLPSPVDEIMVGGVVCGGDSEHNTVNVRVDGPVPTELWTLGNAVSLAYPKAGHAASFQARVAPWLIECFGAEIAHDKFERNKRFLEESLELVQSCGLTADAAHQMVEYVYGRDIGEKWQETGGVMVTLAALCFAQGIDMRGAGETELSRINRPDVIAKVREKQRTKPSLLQLHKP